MIYTAVAGDTAQTLAQRFGVSASRIVFDNQLETGGELLPGQAVLILVPSVTTVVQSGDTLGSIAARYATTELSILRKNPYLANSPLIAGESVVISYEGEGEAEITDVFGYAYPFIIPALLRETLPYLDSLYCFSYGFTRDGELVPEADEPLIEQARLFGAAPVLVLTPRSGREAFNNKLINDIVNDYQARQNFIDNISDVLREKGYGGLDMDFEFISAENRDAYTELIRLLSEELHRNGLTLSVALAPKTYREQPGLLYEGIDYGGIGQYADSVMLMTYEWGYTYGPPLAVAPLPNVRAVVEYALTEIPADKINLGIPNYGYDWALPYRQGTTAAVTIGNAYAIETARRFGATIMYDQTAQSPYFEYSSQGVGHIVWFEDARSIAQKFSLIGEYGLRGAGWWSLMRPFRQNWMLLDYTFRLRDS